MDSTIYHWMAGVVQQIGHQARVLELGSLNVNGSIRPLFQGSDKYIGLDMRAGEGVDLVANANAMMFNPGPFDCIVATSMLEHDQYFWLTLATVRVMLKPGGVFIVTVPTLDFPVHDYPGDYWRFTEQALREVVFEGYHDVHIDHPLWVAPADQQHLKCQHMGGWGHA